jgi:hypothetical protein
MLTLERAQADQASREIIPADELTAANINPVSYLATDYLNHFNEVVMLMEMVATMPDMAEDVMAWEPCGYTDHFRQSVFADKDLAIKAYHAAPNAYRDGLEDIVDELDKTIGDTQIMLSGIDTSAAMDPAVADRLMTTILTELRPAIDRASGIINAVDGALVQTSNDVCEETKMRAQDAIDEMFG